MASEIFSLTGKPGSQASETILIESGEKVRVRFDAYSPLANVNFVIESNGKTTMVPIRDRDAWVTDAVAENDVVSVSAVGGRVSGIIESFE